MIISELRKNIAQKAKYQKTVERRGVVPSWVYTSKSTSVISAKLKYLRIMDLAWKRSMYMYMMGSGQYQNY
jgi:hypothetical protein